MDDYITITVTEHQRLLQAERLLRALQEAGVDNWDGYSEAHRTLRMEDEEC